MKARISTLFITVILLSACGTDTGAQQPAEATQQADGPHARLFSEEIEDRECDLLTAAMVSDLFDVPEDQIDQMAYGGCIYSWDGTPGGEVRVRVSDVFENTDKARRYFAQLTQDMTAGEVAQAMDAVNQQMQEQVAEGEATAKQGEQGRAVTEGLAGQGGIQYTRFDDVGDGAAMESGTLRVLRDNVILAIEYYSDDGNEAANQESALRAARAVVEQMERL